MTRIKLVTALHEMCILIFALRGCYYLAHLYCKICFKSQSLKVFYKTFHERLSCMMFCEAGPALILTVCKQ